MAANRAQVQKIVAAGVVAVLAVAALGTIAIYNAGGKAGESPTASASTTTSAVPTGASPSATAPALVRPGKAELVVSAGDALSDRMDVKVDCAWTDDLTVAHSFLDTEGKLFGESVVARISADYWVRIDRGPLPPYVSGGGSEYNATASGSWGVDVDVEGAGARFSGSTSIMFAGVFWDCGPTPDDVPLSTVDPSGLEITIGEATLNLDAPVSVSVTTPVRCKWRSTREVELSLPRPVVLFGETLRLQVTPSPDLVWLQADPNFPVYPMERALYTFRTSTGHGFGTGTGSVEFAKFAPDPDSYQPAVPLPSGFLRPLGGQEAAASMSGSFSWDCGAMPAGVPEATPIPTIDPAFPTFGPMPEWPVMVLTAPGQPATPGEGVCGGTWSGSGVIDVVCGPIDWWVPDKTIEVKAGSRFTMSMATFTLEPTTLEYASVARVEYYRGGRPDTVASIKPASSTSTTVTYKAPGLGDWVLQFHAKGTGADGSTIDFSYAFRIHVTA
jgi:hypothetical protein